MNTELSIPDTTDIELTQEADSDLASVVGSAGFLPRIQIASSNTERVKEGKAPMGTFDLIWTADRTKNLGGRFNFLSIAARAKALCIPKDGSAPTSYYKRSNPEFEKIVNMADNGPPLNGNMYGSEFLIWIPSEETFATFYLANATLRRVAPTLLAIMEKPEKSATGKPVYRPAPVTSETKLIKTAKYSWHGAIFSPCSEPLGESPDPEWSDKFVIQLKKFRNPPESEVETVEQVSSRER